MKRTKGIREKEKPTAILTGDWHLREDAPICRTDNFQEAQWRKVKFIRELQAEYECPVLNAGDLFEYWKTSPALLSACINNLPKNLAMCLGNHDLPQHNLDLAWKSGVHTLEMAKTVTVLAETHWLQKPENGSLFFPVHDRKVLLWHVMTWQGKEPWPGCPDSPAKSLLKQYPQFDLIITSHNHKRFVETLDGRLLVNPGSITRQAVDQEDHIPAVYLWHAESNTVEEVPLPIEQGVLSREHIERIEQRDSRIDAFVSRLSNEWSVLASYEENMERFLGANKIHTLVEEIVRKAVFP